MLLYISSVIYLTFKKDTAKFVSHHELPTIDTGKSKVVNGNGSEEHKEQVV
jgi:hypothetical protein